SFDPRNGGFGGAPKFPQASLLEFLLLRGEHAMAPATLRAMAAGGIHDQLGGGFARYSVDASWTVPHFEKMLYDNALLARAYLHAWQATGEQELRRVGVGVLEWALREMRGPEGGFYSALGEPRYTEAAIACAEFLHEHMRAPDGRLLRSFNDGRAGIDAYLEDHAFLLEALLALFESSCEERFYERARTLADTLIERFADR